jgi:site-specific DNA-methyltransferase (adenine-specific)
MAQTPSANTLFYGDNLSILREHVADDSVGLIYLDPPFSRAGQAGIAALTPSPTRRGFDTSAFDATVCQASRHDRRRPPHPRR